MTRPGTLRWQLIAAQLLIVVVGVMVLAVASEALGARQFAADVRALLASSAAAPDGLAEALVASFRRTTRAALALAAVAAASVGLTTAVLLLRQILRPLDAIARISGRIAAGRYDERVPVPASAELAALATGFNRMAAALDAVEAQRVALIGNVAHELRTPLAGLEGYLEGLQDGVFAATPETLGELQREVRRMHRLVDDLQTLSSVEAGQIALELADVDLAAVARRGAAQVLPQALAGGLSIGIVVEGDAPVVVRADADRVAQILLNLLSNALRHTAEGGRVAIRVARADGEGRLAVVDNGVGIAAGDLPLVFERFFRVDRSRSRSSGGSGIGLSIARRLARAMGGDVTAASEGEGRGSTFTLGLPLSR